MTNLVELHFRRKKRPSVVELLQLYRNRSGWSRGELASQLGFQSDRMVRKWENGTTLPDSKRLQKLLELYLKKQVFSQGHQQEEAEEFWATVKEAFEIQSHTYEIYPLFDKAWFEALAQEENSAKPGKAGVEKVALNGLSGATNSRHNLPVPVTSFVGRRKEIGQVKSLIKTTRLLTITGAPGCGKSRLALEIARELLAQFQDGVWLVELDQAMDPARILTAIMGAVGIFEPPTFKSLVQKLNGKDGLLLLDNCEHIVEACAELVYKLIRQCPNLTVIAVSRESLGIDGEIVYRLEPLSVQLEENPSNSEKKDWAQDEAIQLFNDRARAVQPDFCLTEETIPLVARLAGRLDGLPLLIELAVQKMEVLTLEQIAERLQNPFYLLKSSSDSIPPRHRSMVAMYDWSYNLLNDREKAFFKHLCLITTPEFNLEVIQELSRELAIDTYAALDLTEALVRKSLVEVEKGGETVTYRLLETARLYGRHKVQEGN